MKQKEWIIDVPEDEFLLIDKITRLQKTEIDEQSRVFYLNAYFNELGEEYHYEWATCGEEFRTFEEAKDYLLRWEIVKIKETEIVNDAYKKYIELRMKNNLTIPDFSRWIASLKNIKEEC